MQLKLVSDFSLNPRPTFWLQLWAGKYAVSTIASKVRSLKNGLYIATNDQTVSRHVLFRCIDKYVQERPSAPPPEPPSIMSCSSAPVPVDLLALQMLLCQTGARLAGLMRMKQGDIRQDGSMHIIKDKRLSHRRTLALPQSMRHLWGPLVFHPSESVPWHNRTLLFPQSYAYAAKHLHPRLTRRAVKARLEEFMTEEDAARFQGHVLSTPYRAVASVGMRRIASELNRSPHENPAAAPTDLSPRL